MGKRQTRIFSKDLINSFPSIAGLEANIVLRNKTVFHGRLLQIKEQTLSVKDLRLNRHNLSLKDIEEIVIDREATY